MSRFRYWLAALLDGRPRISTYRITSGEWLAVDTEGNVWIEAWRAVGDVVSGRRRDIDELDRLRVLLAKHGGHAEDCPARSSAHLFVEVMEPGSCSPDCGWDAVQKELDR